jgi:hypothetical protein
MAINIRQEPYLWTPTYNPMVYVLDSSNAGQPNFRYLADVYVSGDAGYIRLVCNPDPSFNEGVFDVGRVIENYLGGLNDSVDNFDISKSVNGFGVAANSMVAYEIKFGEQYGALGSVTNYSALTVTGTKYAFNGAYDTTTFLDYTGSIAIESTGQFLNEMTSPQSYDFSNVLQDRFLHYITNTSGAVYFAQIKTYDDAGNTIQTALIENPYQNPFYFQYRQYISCGARSLNNATLYSGSQPLIDNSVSGYDVTLTDYFGNATSTTFTFNNDTECYGGRTPITLHFLTTKGAFDSYQFSMVNRYKTKKTTDTYKRKLGKHTNNSYTYNKYDAGTIVHDTRVQARYELQSDWISIDNSLLVQRMIESPIVFMEYGTTLLRGTITSPTEGELKTSALGDIELHNVKVVFELSQEYHRQRG